MAFRVLGDITEIEIIATARGIRELRGLERDFGRGRWRKLKGKALIQLHNGEVRFAELHWYEAHGIGRRKLKIKAFLDL